MAGTAAVTSGSTFLLLPDATMLSRTRAWLPSRLSEPAFDRRRVRARQAGYACHEAERSRHVADREVVVLVEQVLHFDRRTPLGLRIRPAQACIGEEAP